MVVAKNVYKLFGKKKVVEDVSITIQKGKITSLIGFLYIFFFDWRNR